MMTVQEKQQTINSSSINSNANGYGKTEDFSSATGEASCIYALITGKRSVSRRNRVSWYLRQLNKVVKCDEIVEETPETPLDVNAHGSDDINTSGHDGNETPMEQVAKENDIDIVSITSTLNISLDAAPLGAGKVSQFEQQSQKDQQQQQSFLVTPNTRVSFLSKSIATSIVLDLSPSVVSVSSHNNCVFLDSMYDALKRVLHLLVRSYEIPTSSSETKPYYLQPKVYVSVIAYTPFVVAKNNQVLVQNRRISRFNIDQVLVEIWICLTKITQEIHDLVSYTCVTNLDFNTTLQTANNGNVFVFPQPVNGGVIRHPGSVLEDIYELGLFSSSLMPKLSRLSLIIITDGLFSSTNNLNIFRLKSIAISFISLGSETTHPDTCFGYTPYTDLMKFVAKTTLGFYLSHKDLIDSSYGMPKMKHLLLTENPLHKLFSWTLHSETAEEFLRRENTPKTLDDHHYGSVQNQDPIEISTEHLVKYFCYDQPMEASTNFSSSYSSSSDSGANNSKMNNCHDWRSFRQLERNLDADFEQVLSCLLREGYLIRSIQFKRKETTRIVARLVLHWRHNLDLEQELVAPYWSSTDPYELEDKPHRLIMRPFNTPLYGDTYCEVIVHGSYSFLHNLYCDRKSSRRRADYRLIAYKQFRQLIDGVLQTHERLQYLSRFYRDSSMSKIPSFLLHGNSLLYEQPHTHRLTATIENVNDESRPNEFQEYWQKISCLDTKSWKNLMHIHTLRLVLEHDQPKHKNIHYQNANGRYTHVQCRRALSAISAFIKSYASFALLEDTTYVKFIYNRDDDLREIETSATKGFIVIRINKLLPIIVIYLMFTSGILDSHRVQIVSYLEDQLTNCKLRNGRTSSTVQMENVLKSKTISPSSESCCALIKSPLERMLKVYSRNFVNEYLMNNWSYGLPGSCPYSMQQAAAVKLTNQQNNSNNGQQQSGKQRSGETAKENIESYNSNSLTHRYNLVFGKYLYGVRVVQKINNLPHDIIPSLAANVLSKISAILVNLRIKQGFHIAFNNSGILNLVVELAMKDHSHEDHTSSCLCQYIIFPPTVTSNNPQSNIHTILQNNHTSSNGGNALTTTSKSNSLSGSLVNSDGHMKSAQESIQAHLVDNGEIRIIKEYWIEQQYGLSCDQPKSYHHSLENMRYSEIVDHLFVTDSSIFECLLTYDLLQLLCDKVSLYYKLDNSFSRAESLSTPICSPLSASSSQRQADDCPYHHHHGSHNNPKLPSALIEGTNTKDRTPKVPLLELEYKFSVVNFLDFCQQASLTVLLFKDRSDYHECRATQRVVDEKLAVAAEHRNQRQRFRMMQTEATLNSTNLLSSSGGGRSVPMSVPIKCMQSRKMSMDINDLGDSGCEPSALASNKREHRSSYNQEQADATKMHGHIPPTYTYLNPIYSPSLNHMFLETLHKRLKQMHDKELKLSNYDQKRLPFYLKRRHEQQQQQQQQQNEMDDPSTVRFHSYNVDRINSLTPEVDEFSSDMDDDECGGGFDTPDNGGTTSIRCDSDTIDWRCFLRKGNQENLMIVLVPATLSDITKWLNFINNNPDNSDWPKQNYDLVCPLFVFRCSSTMINEHILSFLKDEGDLSPIKTPLESDLSLHFGQPCTYIGELKAYNDELNNEILPLTQNGLLNQTGANSDEKTLEVVHFRAFLRKIKNTVLKSRFNSLNDAYLSELFVHKDDILYYINNVDLDTQKKYHISTQLKSLAEFIKNYEEYNESLPKEPVKPCNLLLNSILLQKCGLFINQPIARFNESNPLMRQLHDKKLVYLMRCNYKVELPIIEENLAGSTLLKKYIKLSTSMNAYNHTSAAVPQPAMTLSSTQTNEKSFNSGNASSLSKSEGTRLMEMKCGSYGASGSGGIISGSPNAVYSSESKSKHHPSQPRLGSNSTLNSLPNSANDNFILEVFRGTKSCSIKEVDLKDSDGVSLRHEAHMAEVLKRTSERKESHHYRRVLKSKTNYNQSHGAIDQALKRVDSLGRLEHFCLTPLLFSPSWRSKLAPVRDHTLEPNARPEDCDDHYGGIHYTIGGKDVQKCDFESSTETNGSTTSANQQKQSALQEAEDRWHQTVCNNYIKEYEQYIQTLGFNSVQIRYQSQPKTSLSGLQASSSSASKSTTKRYSTSSQFPANNSSQSTSSSSTTNKLPSSSLIKSSTTIAANQLAQSTSGTYNTSYLIKFLNSGCLVFKVGFCKPYVYSILYSIEGERFNNSNMKMNMTTFLDELDNIKVTMHLHSFTYDYHLRCMYSYISGRQLNFSPGYHLITFLDDFRKYYQKAPNYARNHILCGEVCVSTNIKVTGQQLYNYIVTHNKAYNMEVLEMCSPLSNLIISNLTNGRSFNDNNNRQNQSNMNAMKDQILAQESNLSRSHANDYVLIELNREKVRYRDGKDPDIFDCGLLITHDAQASQSSRNSLVLKYFLLLTNQRDLYPKLIHTYDNIVSTGCHRPIRLGVCESISRPSGASTKRGAQNQQAHKLSTTTAPSSGQSDLEDVQSSELQSSGELSGPQSILSTANSTQSSGSGLQFGPPNAIENKSLDMQLKTSVSSDLSIVPAIQVESKMKTEDVPEALMTSSADTSLTGGEQEQHQLQVQQQQRQQTNSSIESSSVQLGCDLSPLQARKRVDSTNSSKKNAPTSNNLQDRAICDEEITYLGYFSSDEMDMLKFLQEKTNNLRVHIEQVVRQAEVHYRRDYLWQKLMQRTPTAINQKSDEIPLNSDELLQLFSIVETIDLSSLDPQLSVFTTMHLNWYMKLLKAFSDLKQSNINQHRIYTVKTNKYLLLYIDPKCSTALILLSIDPERSSIELNLLLKDKQEFSRNGQEKSPSKLGNGGDQLALISSSTMDIDQDCQQLINDFINFTAAFMWSTFFA